MGKRLTLGAVAVLVVGGAVLGVWVGTSSAQPGLSRSSLLSQCSRSSQPYYLTSTSPDAVQIRGQVGIVVRRSGGEYSVCGASNHALIVGGRLTSGSAAVKVLFALYAGPSGVRRHGAGGLWAILELGSETKRIGVQTQLGTSTVSYLKGRLALVWFAPSHILYEEFEAYADPASPYRGKMYGVGEAVAFGRNGSVIGAAEIDTCPGEVLAQSPCSP